MSAYHHVFVVVGVLLVCHTSCHHNIMASSPFEITSPFAMFGIVVPAQATTECDEVAKYQAGLRAILKVIISVNWFFLDSR